VSRYLWYQLGLIAWDALLLIAWVGFWLAGIWTTGTDPLSISLCYTAFVMFLLWLGSMVTTIPLIAVLDAKEQAHA
jgi:hypothetical protein